MDNFRYNISPCTPEEAAAFVAKIDESRYIPHGAVMASGKCHYDRYSYSYNDVKVAVVYDTTGHVLSITAPRENAEELRAVFAPDGSKTIGLSTVPAQGFALTRQAEEALASGGGTRSRVFVSPKNIEKERRVGGPTLIVTSNGTELWADEIFPPQKASRIANQENRRFPYERKGSYGYEQKNRSETAASTSPEYGLNISAGGARGGARRATISFGDEDDGRRGTQSAATPVRAGTGLYAEIGVPHETIHAPDNSEFLAPPPERERPARTDKSERAQKPELGANTALVRLKKRIPVAFDYLSEQSRADLSNGLHDLEQTTLTLLDYSVLLVPPYRGLERFVFDLQRAEGINVKMIGQAYDKDESGRYILKRGYQKRIGSIVYSEVMVSLYNEYFSRRNFFAHSDNTGGNASRSIEDKAVVKRIFDNLLNVVEYNARKLKEIGFTLDRSADREA